ncbi:MAG: hypothetical protein A2008_07540 [Candidatus Wallbacteria bacterium GWC2_49_35]|uniref:Sulfatase N-terminal domain-containing protein n=1 Tax=Candidatus Wallbacteria bacterium GWC2_49_35 TaxID=1817813 RepID=A0A1F7X0I1_9BACT|nr:MAG: hypothetical protein A2008_07540 [Candidatus Wallbacteria bacterium GWC2_49_35]HBC74692.1 hypothetical protein [Candidatus Wallbacteria bacterium]
MIYKLHPFLLVLYPFLQTLANNRMDVSFSQTLLPLAVVSVFAALFAAASYAFYKCSAKAAAVTSFFIFIFFSYGHIEDMVFNMFRNANDVILVFSALIIFAIAALKIKEASAHAINNANMVISAFAAALVFMPAFIIASDEHINYSHKAQLSGTFADAAFDADKLDRASLPNIFHVLLDEYGRQDVMNEIYKLDVSEFTDFLRKKGFFVADKSRCNYCYTDLSLLSTFNMDYLNKMVEKFDLAALSDRSIAAKKLIWDNAVFRTAKKAGYKIITFNSGELYTSITDADIHYSPFSGVYYNTFYINMLMNMTPLPVILSAAGANPFLFHDPAANHRKIVMLPFEKIGEIIDSANASGVPVLACLWVDSPHPPFVFDDAGNPIVALKKGAAAIDRWAIESEKDREDYIINYRKQLTFITRKAAGLIDQIIKNSKRPPVILLQSDHGPASRFDFEAIPSDPLTFKERFSVLNAYYFGGKPAASITAAGLHEAISPVNSFRIVFNLYFGANLKLLKDECFHSTWLAPYKFTNVSDR